jgi:hypothetical protein
MVVSATFGPRRVDYSITAVMVAVTAVVVAWEMVADTARVGAVGWVTIAALQEIAVAAAAFVPGWGSFIMVPAASVQDAEPVPQLLDQARLAH